MLPVISDEAPFQFASAHVIDNELGEMLIVAPIPIPRIFPTESDEAVIEVSATGCSRVHARRASTSAAPARDAGSSEPGTRRNSCSTSLVVAFRFGMVK